MSHYIIQRQGTVREGARLPRNDNGRLLTRAARIHHSLLTIPQSPSRRDPAPQFFKPIQHDVDLRWRGGLGLDRLQHQEPLAVGAEVVLGMARLYRRQPLLQRLVDLDVPLENFGQKL